MHEYSERRRLMCACAVGLGKGDSPGAASDITFVGLPSPMGAPDEGLRAVVRATPSFLAPHPTSHFCPYVDALIHALLLARAAPRTGPALSQERRDLEC